MSRIWPCLGLLVGCAPEPVEPPAYDPHPEPPTILRDVALIDDDARFTRPQVPGHRTTMDGRVAVRVQGGPPGTEDLAVSLSFYLFAPEKLEDPILAGPPGAEILADPEPFDVVFPPALEPGIQRFGHHAVCDPTTEFPRPGERPNPYACGPDDAHDCYDITIVSSTSRGVSVRMWGTPVTVEVADPKTATARIVAARLDEPVQGAELPTMNEWTEPAITQDGRLLTGRFGRFPRPWTNPETGERFVRPYDLAYSQLPDDVEPCDVTGWTAFHPMSHAPYDPRMVGRYGLAAYPFRDTEGQPIPDGEDLGGTYPWVDREGANVFMAGVHGRLVEQSTEAYPRRCVHEGCEDYEENTDWDRGFMVGGLWTHGRFVHLDGMINNQDWAVGVTPAAHWMVDLYRTPDGDPVPVRFGGGRFITRARDAGGPYPDGYTHNANILDSLQNLTTHHAATTPITPRDVVWVMGTGVATDEIVFDDVLDPNALIVSTMQASITQLYDESGASMAVPRHWNGQVRLLVAPLPILTSYELVPDQVEDIHLQNGATSLAWRVPPYGLVAAGEGRVEPVALGGIQGKGFWLSGEASIRYELPAQDRPLPDVYLGVFVDPRGDDGLDRDLLTFADGSAIRLAGHRRVTYVVDGETIHEVLLPPTTGWRHLGWRLRDGRREVTLLVDGMALDRVRVEAPLFALTDGTLVVGETDTPRLGVRGWIDELKVLLHDVDPEVACNHARGTLVRVDDHAAWGAVAARYPDWAHGEVADAAGVGGGAFACVHDHGADHAAHLGNLPAGTTSVRDAILFPEGPVRQGTPRPDSTGNRFCLECHHAEGRGGLSLDALAFRPDLPAEDDPRRQPMQPPRRVFGNIPAGWIPEGRGPGGPPSSMVAPPEGALVDRWVLPTP